MQLTIYIYIHISLDGLRDWRFGELHRQAFGDTWQIGGGASSRHAQGALDSGYLCVDDVGELLHVLHIGSKERGDEGWLFLIRVKMSERG